MFRVITIAAIVLPCIANAQDYTTDQSLCRDGSLITDDPRGLMIFKGEILYEGMNCVRTSPKEMLGDGWYKASWDCSTEGTPEGSYTLDLNIAPDVVQVRSSEGTATYERCK